MNETRARKHRFRKGPSVLAVGLFLTVAVVPAATQAQNISFAGIPIGSDFSAPYGVAVDTAGNVFAADRHNHRVVKVSIDGSQSTLGSGFQDPYGIAVDKTGNVYVGDIQLSAVVKILPDGSQTTMGNGLREPARVAVDATGDVFVADLNYGVSEIFPNGTQTVVYGDFVTGLAVDAAGNLFLTGSSMQGYGDVVKIAPSGAVTTLATGFQNPEALAIDGAGDVFVSDIGNLRVLEITPSGTQTTVASAVYAYGVAVDGTGNLYIANTGFDQVVKMPLNGLNLGNINVCPGGQNTPAPCSQTMTLSYDASTAVTLGTPNVLTGGAPNLDFTLTTGSTCTGFIAAYSSCTVNVTFAPRFAGLRSGAVQITDGSGNVLATTYISGTGLGPQIAFGSGTQTTVRSGSYQPFGVAADAAGDVFIAESGLVEKVSPNGTITTVGSGLAPEGVAVDGAGNLFIADSDNNRAIEISPNGTPTTVLSGLSEPIGVAVDGAGDVFIADTGNSRVVEVSPNGTQTTVGSGLNQPYAVAVDGVGNVFIADTWNNRVVEVSPSGTQTTVGSGLNFPDGVAVDAADDVFIADSRNNRIVEVSPSGTQTTVNSGLPFGVAVDGSGDILVAETENNSVVKIVHSQPPALTFAATQVNSTSSDSPQAVVIENIGNEPLTATGLTVGSNFAQVPGLGSPADCTANFSLVPGDSCNLSLSFTPKTAGSLQSTATLTDNHLNGKGATQLIGLVGTGQQASQTITFNAIPSQPQGSTLSLTASASSGLPVTFASLSPVYCTVSGTIATMVNGGACSIQASQGGNANYSAATPVTQSFTVTQAAQTLTFAGLPTTATYGSAGPYTLNATASSGLAVTYTVTGPASISGSTLTVTAAGTVVVTASQAGNANYAAAKSVSQTVTVTAASQTITFNAIAAQRTGTSVALSSSASSGLPVSFASLTPAVCSVSGQTATMIAAGTCSIQASQAGNAQYAAAPSRAQSFAVTTPPPAADFTITPSPGSETISRGVLGAFILQLKSVNGFQGNVQLSCSGGPTGSYCADLPQTILLKGTAYVVSGILFPQKTSPGSYSITFKGTSGSITTTATATFTIK